MLRNYFNMNINVFLCSILAISAISSANDLNENKKKSWRDKDIRDMTDADMEHLLDQWEV